MTATANKPNPSTTMAPVKDEPYQLQIDDLKDINTKSAFKKLLSQKNIEAIQEIEDMGGDKIWTWTGKKKENEKLVAARASQEKMKEDLKLYHTEADTSQTRLQQMAGVASARDCIAKLDEWYEDFHSTLCIYMHNDHSLLFR